MVSRALSIAVLSAVPAAVMLHGAPARAPVILSADGSGNTYALIHARGFGLETPDCGHPVPHVREVFDSTLHEYVFAFDIHRDLDDDRCQGADRQRLEIKTAPPGSPTQQHTFGETAHYRWKFRLGSDFRASRAFTHLFQIKAYGGEDAGMPILTITPRVDALYVLFMAPSGQSGSGAKAQTDLAPFRGTWVEAFVRYLSHDSGSIQVLLRRLSDGATLLSWSSDTLDTWRSGTTYNRGKWGIYRSLRDTSLLRDETVLFNDWCVSESRASDCPSEAGEAG